MTYTAKSLQDFNTPDLSDEAVADAIIKAVDECELSALMLRPLVLSWVIDERRHAVRSSERAVRAAPRRSFVGAEALQAEVAAERCGNWKALLALTFRIERGGKVVTWGEATVEEHRLRAEALDRQCSSIAATASLHRNAIVDIESAHVTCLNDLAEVAA